jgi:hypothetical protein
MYGSRRPPLRRLPDRLGGSSAQGTGGNHASDTATGDEHTRALSRRCAGVRAADHRDHRDHRDRRDAPVTGAPVPRRRGPGRTDGHCRGTS